MRNLNKSIKVIIIEDYSLFRVTLKNMLRIFAGVEVCAVFDNAEEAVSYIEKNKDISIVLLDMSLSSINGIEASSIIKNITPQTKIILMLTINNASEILASLCANVEAYILKDISQKELFKVITTVANGGNMVDFRIPFIAFSQIKVLPESDYLYFSHLLSPEETQLIKLVLSGVNKTNIIKILNISFEKLYSLIFSIFSKLAKTEKVETSGREIKYDLL